MQYPYLISISILLFCVSLKADTSPETQAYPLGDALYQHGRGDPADFPKALEAFLSAAESGHPSAQFYAGRMYQLGHGVSKDYAKAAHWYATAGENGQARAYNNLGNIYTDEKSGLYDPAKGMQAYKMASAMGMAMASYNIGNTYLYAKDGFEKDPEKAVAYYTTCLRQYPNYPGAWNNLGVARRQASNGRSDYYAAAEQAFLNALKLDSKWAPYNLADLYYDKRRPASPARIIELLEIGAAKDRVRCLNRLGYFYQTGTLVGQDLTKAVTYYMRSAELGSDIGQNWLAILLEQTGQEPLASPRVISLLEAAVEAGNIYAKNNLGYRVLEGEIEGYTAVDGSRLLMEAAEGGLDDAFRNLDYFSRKLGDAMPLSTEQRAAYKRIREQTEQAAREEARKVLTAAAPLVASKHYEEALEQVTGHFESWQGLEQNEWAFEGVLWWEAQTQQGRADPEWGWRLFEWIKNYYDSKRRNNVTNRLFVRYNLAQSLIESGRLGMVRQVSDEIYDVIDQLIGIDVAQVLADHRLSRTAFPLHYTADMLTGFNTAVAEGDWLDLSFFIALSVVVEERIHAADWGTATQLCDWIETWAVKRLNDREGLEGDNRPGWVQNTYLDARLLRARMYELQKDYAAAAAVYAEIIERNWKPYQGRVLDTAISRQAALALKAEDIDAVDINGLLETVERRKKNHFDTEEGFQFTRLVIASKSYRQGDSQSARETTDEILAYADSKQRPWLRLEALLASVDLYLAGEDYTLVEEQLFEALSWTRAQGLKVREPEIYERYIRYLTEIGNWDRALEVQQDHIALVKNLDLPLALNEAWTGLAEIYRKMGLSQSELRALEQEATPAERRLERMAELKKETHKTSAVSEDNFDLQPMRMLSTCIPGVEGRALFVLSNLTPLQKNFTVSARSQQPAGFEAERESEVILIKIRPRGGESVPVPVETSLAAFEQQFIEIRWPDSLQAVEAMDLSLVVTGGSLELSSELVVRSGIPSASTVIIESQELEDNPFYLLSAFHHLAPASSEQNADYRMRAIAERPTRIEAYGDSGALLFIDAEGNGDFNDPGDVLATHIIKGGSPVISMTGAPKLIELRYQALVPLEGEPIHIELQRAAGTTDGEWTTDVVDRIVPFQQPTPEP